MFRFAVAGLGLGLHHAQRILDSPFGWTVTAVCDALPERIDRLTSSYSTVQGYQRFEDMLAAGDFDGVIIAMPHDLHAPMAIAAMEAGKHVLVEKPMARTVAECRAMNSVARRTGRTLMVAQNWRYTPWVRSVKRALDSGELGPLRVVRTEWLQNAVIDPRPGNWLLDGERAGGGPIVSLMVHNLDCLRYLLGEPVRVQALCVRGHPAFTGNAESWALAVFEFASGVIGQMFTSYAAYTPDAVPLAVYGDEGTLLVTDAPRINSLRRGGGYTDLDIVADDDLPTGDPALNEFLHFVAAAEQGRAPLTGGDDNIKTMAFIEAMYRSASTGETISLQDVLA